MGTQESSNGGHACILVGEAREAMKQAGLFVRVHQLVSVLRQEGVPEEKLRSVAVVVHSANAALGDRGGSYRHGATLTCRVGSGLEQEFGLFIEATVGGDPPLPFVVAHEAGHASFFLRGKSGHVWYNKPNVVRWVQRVARGLLGVLALLWVAIFVLSHASTLETLAVALVAGLLLCTATMPYFMLWLASSAEWKANWFCWRYRKAGIVGNEPDDTEVIYTSNFRRD